MNDLFSQLDWRALVLPAMVPLFLAALLAEAARFRGHGRFLARDSFASIGLGALYMVFDTLVTVTLVALVFQWAWHHRLFDITMTPLTGVLLFALLELCYYAFHRASHRVRWFWSAHVAHHSSTYMNFSTAMRQSALYALGGNWLFYLPLALLGFEPVWIFFMLTVNLAYQYFVHTQWVGKLHPAIEFIFNTPSHHRAHHGRNPEYIDRNYGGIVILYDRLFGTFVEEQDQVPVQYGITRPVNSFNPLWLTVHEWVAMFRDAARPGPLKQRLKHFWAPPEWERDD
ncbi:sterol desaturase [Alcanivorax sp. N3-2A]|nr:sterol desaturase [Alcanivorax sp. N3-2A]|tara:strand:+ start:23847 stop:24701 length:855 start_codon:yes stop_codon:yes gene_type:complete